MRYSNAIVKPPGQNFSEGLTCSQLGPPDYTPALRQHDAYCETLRTCGLSVIALEPDERYPDSTFVEDTALITDRRVVLTRPGAKSRQGEVDAIAAVLRDFFSDLRRIEPPGTVDAGDVCEAGNHFFIGVSHRTNEDGAWQLARLLAEVDYTSSLIDIREVSNILHLKSGMAFLGDGHLVTIEELSNRDEFLSFELIHSPPPGEEYAANCLLLNGVVLVAEGFPLFEQRIQQSGFRTIALEMSEFQKMDGGLSCLSLRF